MNHDNAMSYSELFGPRRGTIVFAIMSYSVYYKVHEDLSGDVLRRRHHIQYTRLIACEHLASSVSSVKLDVLEVVSDPGFISVYCIRIIDDIRICW